MEAIRRGRMAYKPSYPPTPASPVIPVISVISGDPSSKEITKITAITGVENKRERLSRNFLAAQVAAIKAAWKRIIGIDVEQERIKANFKSDETPRSVEQHLRSIAGATPLADVILRDVELHGCLKPKQKRKLNFSDDGAVSPDLEGDPFFDDAILGTEFTPVARKFDPSKPGISAADVYRVFGNRSRSVITAAAWAEVSEADQQAIEAELSSWVRRDKWRKKTFVMSSRTCLHCSKRNTFAPAWRRPGKIVEATTPDGAAVLICSYCGRKWKHPRKKKQ
jgi:hypothetical protein